MITIKWTNLGFCLNLNGIYQFLCDDQQIMSYLNIDSDVFYEFVKECGGFTTSDSKKIISFSRFKLFCQAEEMLEALQPYIIMKEISG